MQSNNISLSHPSNSKNNDESNSSESGHTTIWNNRQHKESYYVSDNSIFVNVTTKNSREKHISAALERIQRERDNFDEL